MSSIRPNTEQFAEFAAAVDDGPVVMLNLLKFKSGGGAKAYGEYGNAASKMVEQTGGRLMYSGRCDQVLIGDAGADWDAIAVVEYPSRKAFMAMVTRDDYMKAHEHREAGLDRTMLYATTPTSVIKVFNEE